MDCSFKTGRKREAKNNLQLSLEDSFRIRLHLVKIKLLFSVRLSLSWADYRSRAGAWSIINEAITFTIFAVLENHCEV